MARDVIKSLEIQIKSSFNSNRDLKITNKHYILLFENIAKIIKLESLIINI